ncbi:MAG TPA: ASCH domain-containing protein [Bacteroidia bacterium]|jgi:hypothetical protein|nr:ASCH domain-containing protein [Bacteroidia bacterium]
MALIGFRKQFERQIKNGRKKQTVRKFRKRPIKVGEKLHLYTGLRTKDCKKIKDVVCKSIDRVTIQPSRSKVFISNYELRLGEIEIFAKADGFKNSVEFFELFKKMHGSKKFEGNLIKW